MRLIVLARRRVAAASDAGFSLMETIVAVMILTIVMAAATAFFINNAHSVGGQSQRQNAVYLADQQLEAVRSVPPAKLFDGRTSAAVTTLNNSGLSLLAQDDTSGNYDALATSASTQEIPTTQTKTVNSVVYTIRTFINKCYLTASSGICDKTSSSTTAQEYRVIVDVAWTPTGNRACVGGCAYTASTLIDPSGDPKFNSNISQPTISGIAPTSMAVTTTRTLTINGTNFVNGAIVTISSGGGTSPLTPTSNSGTQIKVDLTAGSTPGSYTVSVVNPDGGRASTSFTENPLPNVTSMSPNPVTGGSATTITINGTGFQSGATVTATNTQAALGAVTFVSSTQLTVAGFNGNVAGGPSTITVTNPDQGTGTATLTVKSKPTISSAAPNARVGQATTVTLTGSGFQSGFGVTATQGTIGTTTFTSSNSVSFIYTPTSAGSVNFTLTNPDGGTDTEPNVTVLGALPTISSVSPQTMSKSTTQTFTITGTAFVSGATVSFKYQGNPVTITNVTWTNSTTMTFQYTAPNVTGNFVLTVNVTNPDAGVSNTYTFTLKIT